MFFQTPIVIAEGMRCKTYAALSLYQIDEILRRYALFRVILNPEGNDIPLQGEEFDSYKNRESSLTGILSRIFL